MHRRISKTAMGLALVLAVSSCMRTADRASRGPVESGRSYSVAPSRGSPAASPRALHRRCPKAPAFRPGAEGAVAYVADGRLHVMELASGRDRVLVHRPEAPVGGPVAFSPDGRWIAFGHGLVVASAGGEVCSPLRRRGSPGKGRTPCSSWRWLPGRNVLIGQTRRGRLIEARTGGRRRRLPIRAGTWAVDPSGRYVAYAVFGAPRIQQIRVYDLVSGTRRVIYQTAAHRIAPPLVAEWSPDGAWVLFWPDIQNSASLAADGLPLRAVSTNSGRRIRIAPVMLAYERFLTWCGDDLVAAVGGDRYVTHRKRLVLATRPVWGTRALTPDRSRSFYEPVCSPDGARVAVVSTRSGWEPRFDVWDRSLWIVSFDDRSPKRLLSTRGFSYENPIWSGDGRSALVVRRRSKPRAGASLCLASVNRPGTCSKVADLGRVGFGYYGINGYGVDWYQPRS